MKKSHRSTKRQHRRLLHTFLLSPHVWWGVACAALIVTMASFMVQTESLRNKNEALAKQLATEKTDDNTCRIVGNWKADGLTEVALPVGGLERGYLVHTPKNFDASKYYPLVVFYAGKGATATGAQQAYGLDALPAIVVYPVPTVGEGGFTSWQGAPYASGADDVAFTAALLNDLQSKLCINRTHVYAAGFSNGGGFAALLSCTMSDRFAAYAIIAGALYPPEDSCKAPAPTPIINIHGTSDPTVPYAGSPTRKLPAIESWARARAAGNGCSSRPITTYQTGTTVVTTWHSCKRNATVQNVRIEGGGHKWGGVSDSTLWDFLSRFSL